MIPTALLSSLRHQRRYREIVAILAHHGFGAVLHQLGISERFNPRRLLRGEPGRAEAPTAPMRLRLAMEALGPTFIKIGQILSTRPDVLPAEYIDELSCLQDSVPPGPWEEAKRVIEAELEKPIAAVFSEIEEHPLASASLAQVHAARLADGREVVVKVQRAGIDRVIEQDLAIFADIAHLAQQRTAIGRRLEVYELALEFGNALRAELDFRREGRNADRIRESFKHEKHLRVPIVYWEYTTQRVMVQERLRGIKLDSIAALESAGLDRRELADHCAHIVLREVLTDGFFHADPHPGNLLALPGNVIGLLDFGTVGHLDARDRLSLVRLFTLLVQLDVSGVVDQLQRMGIADWSVDREALNRDLRRLLVRYYGLALEDISGAEMLHEVQPIIQRHQLRVPSDYLLLVKTIVVMQGVGLALAPDYNVFDTARPYVRRLLLRSAMPETWVPGLLRTAGDWTYLAAELPRQTVRIMGLVERGDLQVQASLPQLGDIFGRVEAIANRAIYGVLLAALTVALALLMPRLDLTWPWHLLTWAIVIAFFFTAFLAAQLLWSIFRSARKWDGHHRP